MNKNILLTCILLASSSSFANDETLKKNLSDSEQRIQDLEKQLNQEISRNNAIRAKLAGQTDTLIPETAEEYNLADLAKKVKILEDDVVRLKGVKLDGARTEAEALATKDAQAHAPQLDINSPLFAQYNQASSLYTKGELALAREAFTQIVKTTDVPATDMCVTRSWQHLGEIHQKQKNFRLSEEAYKEALKRSLPISSLIECRLGLTETLIALGETKEACDHVVALEKMEKQHLDSSQKGRLTTLANLCKSKTEKKVAAPLSPASTPVVANTASAASLTPHT